MPQITPLALSTPKPSAPGWAYVLESAIGPDPSKQPLISISSNNTKGKKRSDAGPSRAAAKSATEALMSSHSKARAARQRQRLDDMNVELGHRGHFRSAGSNAAGEASGATGSHHGGGSGGTGGIEVPAAIKKEIQESKWKITKGGGKAVGIGAQGQGKLTQNVRRVLTSTKNWGHHAADEEAARQHAQSHGTVPRRERERDKDVIMIDTPTTAEKQSNDQEEDEDLSSLLQVSVPTFPSQDVLDKLIKAPPLSYSVVRAQTSSTERRPNRKFCVMCGYWGRVRCTFCGANVCSLVCKGTHDLTEHPHTSR